MNNINDLLHLTGEEIQQIHDSILNDYSGLKGSRPDLSVHALVGRIQSNLTYKQFHSLVEVAALYAEVIARGHVFNDGNKRTALVCMITFLEVNGYQFLAGQIEIADKMVGLSDGRINYKLFSQWLVSKISPISLG